MRRQCRKESSVRSVVIRALSLVVLFTPQAFAQDAPAATTGMAFPGSFWIASSTAGPAEPHNVVTQANVEQGVVVWRNDSWFIVPFVGASLTRDTEGYSWNDKNPATAAIKLTKRVPGGIVSVGGGVMFEENPGANDRRHPTAFAQYWAGWTGDSQAQLGKHRLAYPGHTWVNSGLVTGRDPRNWITAAAVQQGVAIGRWHGVAPVVFTSGAGTVDTERRAWENRVQYEGGVKVVRYFVGSVVEGGIAERNEHRFIANTNHTGLVGFVNVWIGWDPRRF